VDRTIYGHKNTITRGRKTVNHGNGKTLIHTQAIKKWKWRRAVLGKKRSRSIKIDEISCRKREENLLGMHDRLWAGIFDFYSKPGMGINSVTRERKNSNMTLPRRSTKHASVKQEKPRH
jgi:hypothetical protein